MWSAFVQQREDLVFVFPPLSDDVCDVFGFGKGHFHVFEDLGLFEFQRAKGGHAANILVRIHDDGETRRAKALFLGVDVQNWSFDILYVIEGRAYWKVMNVQVSQLLIIDENFVTGHGHLWKPSVLERKHRR